MAREQPQQQSAVGWTCDLSYDLMGESQNEPHQCNPRGVCSRRFDGNALVTASSGRTGRVASQLPFWTNAPGQRRLPFRSGKGTTTPGSRFGRPPGLFPGVSVAGGVVENTSSYGPGVEFIDALPNGDAAQSWANQAVAAKFAKVLDENRNYNIWDARAHLRQSASKWQEGWNERNGYGRPTTDTDIIRLLPEPPVQFATRVSADGRQVLFTWRNFTQSRFRTTVIARGDGRIIYKGKGTRFVWNSDVNGSETFRYWSRDNAGQTSPIQSYQVRTVSGLSLPP